MLAFVKSYTWQSIEEQQLLREAAPLEAPGASGEIRERETVATSKHMAIPEFLFNGAFQYYLRII